MCGEKRLSVFLPLAMRMMPMRSLPFVRNADYQYLLVWEVTAANGGYGKGEAAGRSEQQFLEKH